MNVGEYFVKVKYINKLSTCVSFSCEERFNPTQLQIYQTISYTSSTILYLICHITVIVLEYNFNK